MYSKSVTCIFWLDVIIRVYIFVWKTIINDLEISWVIELVFKIPDNGPWLRRMITELK